VPAAAPNSCDVVPSPHSQVSRRDPPPAPRRKRWQPTLAYPVWGITEITPADIEKAAADGKKYKLIGHVWREGDAVRGSVSPQLVDLDHPLAGVGGATNAMTISTAALGDVTVVGPGAGRRETGFAVLNDLLHMRRHS